MRCTTKLLAAVAAVSVFTFGEATEAQYVGPVNRSYPPPAPAAPTYVQPAPSYVYPVSPGGIVTGNPSPSYDPNAVVGGNSSGSAYWDPYRGWVTNTQNTSVLNSATSPGRAPAPGSSIQYYNSWDGTKWVRGSRWLGQDGLWHGDHSNTVVGPNGSTQTDRTVYAPNPRAGGSTAPRPSQQPQRPYAPMARPGYVVPR